MFGKDTKLKIMYKAKSGEISILGNKKGLEFLSDCCIRIIGKNDPSGHFHLTPEMNNLAEGSTPTIIEYSDRPEDYEKCSLQS